MLHTPEETSKNCFQKLNPSRLEEENGTHTAPRSPTENLKEEHRVIERMLVILNVLCDKLERDEVVSPVVFERSIDFIRVFADRCHHGKEEENLFPMIEKHGFPKRGGPIGVMLIEHEQGRGYVRGLADAVARYERGDETARKEIVQNARGYAELLAHHILKEDNVLYPLADKVITADERKELVEKFEDVERERIGEGKHQEYLQLVSDLEKQLRIG